jgi:hypothetical protein
MIRTFEETVTGPAPDGWTKGYVTLQLYSPEQRLPIEAWRRDAFAVHERETWDGKEAVLTHAPTGLRINSFGTVDDAVECADKIQALADWGAIDKRFDTGSDLFPKVRDVVDTIKNRTFEVVGSPRGQS